MSLSKSELRKLRRRLFNQEMNLADVARQHGCTIVTVSNFFKCKTVSNPIHQTVLTMIAEKESLNI